MQTAVAAAAASMKSTTQPLVVPLTHCNAAGCASKPDQKRWKNDTTHGLTDNCAIFRA